MVAASVVAAESGALAADPVQGKAKHTVSAVDSAAGRRNDGGRVIVVIMAIGWFGLCDGVLVSPASYGIHPAIISEILVHASLDCGLPSATIRIKRSGNSRKLR